MNSNFHVVSNIVSVSGFHLSHLTDEQYESLIADMKELDSIVGNGGYQLTDFNRLKLSTSIVKRLIVDFKSFLELQCVKKTKSTNIEIINDMIKMISEKHIVPCYIRLIESEANIDFKVEKATTHVRDWSCLEPIFKNHYSECMQRIKFILLGDNNEFE